MSEASGASGPSPGWAEVLALMGKAGRKGSGRSGADVFGQAFDAAQASGASLPESFAAGNAALASAGMAPLGGGSASAGGFGGLVGSGLSTGDSPLAGFGVGGPAGLPGNVAGMLSAITNLGTFGAGGIGGNTDIGGSIDLSRLGPGLLPFFEGGGGGGGARLVPAPMPPMPPPVPPVPPRLSGGGGGALTLPDLKIPIAGQQGGGLTLPAVPPMPPMPPPVPPVPPPPAMSPAMPRLKIPIAGQQGAAGGPTGQFGIPSDLLSRLEQVQAPLRRLGATLPDLKIPIAGQQGGGLTLPAVPPMPPMPPPVPPVPPPPAMSPAMPRLKIPIAGQQGAAGGPTGQFGIPSDLLSRLEQVQAPLRRLGATLADLKIPIAGPQGGGGTPGGFTIPGQQGGGGGGGGTEFKIPGQQGGGGGGTPGGFTLPGPQGGGGTPGGFTIPGPQDGGRPQQSNVGFQESNVRFEESRQRIRELEQELSRSRAQVEELKKRCRQKDKSPQKSLGPLGGGLLAGFGAQFPQQPAVSSDGGDITDLLLLPLMRGLLPGGTGALL